MIPYTQKIMDLMVGNTAENWLFLVVAANLEPYAINKYIVSPSKWLTGVWKPEDIPFQLTGLTAQTQSSDGYIYDSIPPDLPYSK